MRLTLFIYILFLGTLVGNAQIKGFVVDGEKGQPLSGVHIYLQKDSVGMGITDANGEFKFTCPDIGVADTLVFSYIGYSTFKCTLHELQYLDKVIMYERPQLLHEIIIGGERFPFFLKWTLLASLPQALYSYGGFLHDGKIYIVAGDKTLVYRTKYGTEAWEYRSTGMYVYDIATDVWEKYADGFAPRAGHAAHFYKDNQN